MLVVVYHAMMTTKQFDPSLPHQGENVPTAKLDEDKVREIRALAAAGVFHRELGKRFGVTRDTIREVVSRRSWGHVAPEKMDRVLYGATKDGTVWVAKSLTGSVTYDVRFIGPDAERRATEYAEWRNGPNPHLVPRPH